MLIGFYIAQWLVTGRWFSPGTLVSSTKKADRHDITEMLLTVALNIINLNLNFRNIETLLPEMSTPVVITS